MIKLGQARPIQCIQIQVGSMVESDKELKLTYYCLFFEKREGTKPPGLQVVLSSRIASKANN